jgi:hypothetical protein
MSDQDIELSHGFSAGNYCNAYETQDLEGALKKRAVASRSPAYRAAFVLGFFASYELHEIPSSWREEFDEAYHSKHGQRVLELGYTDPRTEDYANEETA